MRSLFIIFCTVLMLQSCGPHSASVIGSGIGLATTNNVPRILLTNSTDALIKKKTGKTTLDHLVSGSYLKEEIRDCEVYNSSKLNEIFFETLDELHCKTNH